MEMLRKDIIGVISKYFEVDADDVDVEIRNTNEAGGVSATRLTTDVPIRSVKNLGRNKY
jgi:cell division topological specificity factor